MGLPVVAPALPGNVELLGRRGRRRSSSRATTWPPTRAPGRADRATRTRRASSAPRAASGSASASRSSAWARRTARSTTELLERPAGVPAHRRRAARRAGPLRFHGAALHEHAARLRDRPVLQPRPLPAASASTPSARRRYPAVETIVVDDASTDPETIAVLDELERRDDVTSSGMPRTGAEPRPQRRARPLRAGATCCRSTPTTCCYPDAIERLVEQLRRAGEQVGFIYPNLQYFGNREDYFEAPDWNLYALMQRNVCDDCSLFDREVFDAGSASTRASGSGHEDWEFVVRLAARGVRASRPTRAPCATARWASTAPTRSSTARPRFRRSSRAGRSTTTSST